MIQLRLQRGLYLEEVLDIMPVAEVMGQQTFQLTRICFLVKMRRGEDWKTKEQLTEGTD